MAKIALIVTKSEFGGVQEYLRILMSSLNRYEVVLISGDKGFLTDAASRMNLRYRVCPGLIQPISPIKDAQAILNMHKLLREEQPDIIHTNSSKAGVVARIAGMFANIPTIFTAHGWAFTEGTQPKNARLYRFIEKIAAPITQKIICVSNYDKGLAVQHQITEVDRMVTIHNGISNIANCSATHENPIPNIIMVARFSKQKDYATLLHAISEMRDLDFTVRCVGDGPQLGEMQALAKQLDVTHKVEFLGPRSDVPNLLQSSDIFVLATNWEGLPISILEAMRASLPVVASRVGGVSEAVVHGVTGLLINPQSIEGLSHALRRLVNDRELRQRMGLAGQQRYLSMFTAERMVRETTHIYDQVLLRKARILAVKNEAG